MYEDYGIYEEEKNEAKNQKKNVFSTEPQEKQKQQKTNKNQKPNSSALVLPVEQLRMHYSPRGCLSTTKI